MMVRRERSTDYPWQEEIVMSAYRPRNQVARAIPNGLRSGGRKKDIRFRIRNLRDMGPIHFRNG